MFQRVSGKFQGVPESFQGRFRQYHGFDVSEEFKLRIPGALILRFKDSLCRLCQNVSEGLRADSENLRASQVRLSGSHGVSGSSRKSHKSCFSWNLEGFRESHAVFLKRGSQGNSGCFWNGSGAESSSSTSQTLGNGSESTLTPKKM